MSVGSWLVLGGTLEGGGIAGVVYAARRMFPVWRERPQPALEARTLPAIRSSRPGAGVPPALTVGPRVLEGKVIERGRIERLSPPGLSRGGRV